MLRAPLSLLLLLALSGWAAGQYMENQEYDVDENGLPMDSGNVETNDEDQTLVDKREDEEEKEDKLPIIQYGMPAGMAQVMQYMRDQALGKVPRFTPPHPQAPVVEQQTLTAEQNAGMERIMEKLMENAPEETREEFNDFIVHQGEEEKEKTRPRLVPEEAFLMSTSKPLGEISGMAMDKKGRLVVFHRADRVWDESTFDGSNRLSSELKPIVNSTIAIINATTGQVLEEHGENLFYLPHGLSIDGEGNIWVTDVGSHQIHKLGADYKPVLTLGEKLVPGTDGDHFCQPTDVAVAKNGIFFVADGYCNSRVVKFDKNGNVLAVFEAPDDQLGSSPFLIPHSLALIEDLNLLCVADRENERVQCYSSGLAEGHRSIPAGIPITSAENIGRVYAIREKNHYLVGVTGADGDGTLEPQLFTMDMETGKANTFLKGIENAHALAISDDGKVYVGQMTPNQIVVVDLA